MSSSSAAVVVEEKKAPAMNYVFLGRTGVKVSEVCLGALSFAHSTGTNHLNLLVTGLLLVIFIIFSFLSRLEESRLFQLQQGRRAREEKSRKRGAAEERKGEEKIEI